MERICRDERFAPWQGYRTNEEQEDAKAAGFSRAGPGESPHNFYPSFACDLVLDPRHVKVAAHPDDPQMPNLWDRESPEAQHAWQALEAAALREGLERVNVNGRRDLPHVQLAGWRER